MTPTTTAAGAKSTKVRAIMAALLVGGALVSQVTQAAAVSPAVRVACLSDYLSNCSAHSVGSPELRKCMRAVGSRLSNRCINALVAAGEVSKAEVSRRSTASAN
jgi:uncharacterized protein with ACT and thioredoxin-like domain